MKKLIFILSTFIVCILLVSCGTQSVSSLQPTSTTTETVASKAKVKLENSDLVAAVEKNGSWGYINTKGDFVIEPQYDQADDFSEGFASVCIDGLYGYIDKTGELVIRPQYESVCSFSEGLALVEKDGIVGYIDTIGNMKIKLGKIWREDNSLGLVDGFAVDDRNKFKNGFAVCGYWDSEGKICQGLINSKGEYILPCKYFSVYALNEKVFAVQETETSPIRCFNTSGSDITDSIIKNNDIIYISVFREGLAQVKTKEGLFGYANTNGDIVIKPRFESAAVNFSEGCAAVMVKDEFGRQLWGFIDTTGKIIIEPRFNIICFTNPFSDGLALVHDYELDKDGNWINGCSDYYIDHKGKAVIKLSEDVKCNPFVNGYAKIEKGSKVGFIDTTGNTIIECQYDKAGDFCYVNKTEITNDDTKINTLPKVSGNVEKTPIKTIGNEAVGKMKLSSFEGVWQDDDNSPTWRIEIHGDSVLFIDYWTYTHPGEEGFPGYYGTLTIEKGKAFFNLISEFDGASSKERVIMVDENNFKIGNYSYKRQ